jgi:undecaprenyl diphosphate synthase
VKDEQSKIPTHVAIIMDGNGRWAQKRGWPRIRGHREGAESVRAILRACKKAGVKYLTLYAFSTENWIRPKTEVNGLMGLLGKFLKEQAQELHENHVRLRTIGHIDDLPKSLQKELDRVKHETAHYKGGTLTLALSYGGRVELTDAVRQLAKRVQDGALDPQQITEKMISESLYAPDIPDPDLMIRTSGEMRISNFLLWQLAYTEFYITDVLWPDFREVEFMKALDEYSRRHRRFGNIK